MTCKDVNAAPQILHIRTYISFLMESCYGESDYISWIIMLRYKIACM